MRRLKPHLAGKRHVIWDWNGTLLDDVELVVEIVGRLLAEHGRPAVSKEAYRKFFGFPVIEYYRKLGFDFKKLDFAKLSDWFMREYQKRFGAVRLHAGAREFLHELKSEGWVQSVLSASRQKELEEQLLEHGLRDCFAFVYGLSNNHAASKVERGRELLAASGVPAKDTILIGDTDHDLEVGKAMGVDVLLLADGHQAYERLKALHDRVLDSR